LLSGSWLMGAGTRSSLHGPRYARRGRVSRWRADSSIAAAPRAGRTGLRHGCSIVARCCHRSRPDGPHPLRPGYLGGVRGFENPSVHALPPSGARWDLCGGVHYSALHEAGRCSGAKLAR
jgi:hypothetical protein